MRIRKNSLRAHSESSSGLKTPLQAHFCQLNQSPWDLSTNLSPSSPSSPSLQVEGDKSLFQNKGFGDLIGALESLASLRKSLEGEENGCVYDVEEEEKDRDDTTKYCLKTDENGNWICGLEVKEGETFCEFHLRSYIVPDVVVPPVVKKSTKNRAKKPKPDSNPYESVYYSEFEPTWGKRKIARELSKIGEVVVMPVEESEKWEDSEEGEQGDKEEIEVENSSENEKKRVRKHMKARSLKSLM
ncbi:hypothetical protein POM88_029990 [Heracleum sosnowskyi]|uniref:WRC domain-containing protein n=1 Tax=Heracleum sosnowskyi TaxID=360622 RepID=A0AAD8HWM0_9APIA|nr:hypothetical protein POM88_029990 [Heracleum sosnowskyi]